MHPQTDQTGVSVDGSAFGGFSDDHGLWAEFSHPQPGCQGNCTAPEFFFVDGACNHNGLRKRYTTTHLGFDDRECHGK